MFATVVSTGVDRAWLGCYDEDGSGYRVALKAVRRRSDRVMWLVYRESTVKARLAARHTRHDRGTLTAYMYLLLTSAAK